MYNNINKVLLLLIFYIWFLRSNSMCQINACLISDGSEQQIMEDVQLLDFEDDDIVLRDLFGDEKRLKAKIKLINIAKNKILLEAL